MWSRLMWDLSRADLAGFATSGYALRYEGEPPYYSASDSLRCNILPVGEFTVYGDYSSFSLSGVCYPVASLVSIYTCFIVFFTGGFWKESSRECKF